MGDAADYQTERDIDRALYPRGFDAHMKEQTNKINREIIARSEWTMKDGKKIKFRDMELSHLENVSKLIERRNHKYASQLRDYYEHRALTIPTQPEGG